MKYTIINIFLIAIYAISSSDGHSLRGLYKRGQIQTTTRVVRKVQETAAEALNTTRDKVNATATSVKESIEEKNVTGRVQDAVSDVVDTEALEETLIGVVENIDKEEIKDSKIGDIVEGAGDAAGQVADNIDKELVSEVADAVNQTLSEMTKEEIANKTLEALEDEDVQEALVDVVESANDVVEAFDNVIQSVDKDEVTNVIIENVDVDTVNNAFDEVTETVDIDGAVDVIDNAISEVVENEKVAGVIEKAAGNEKVADVVETLDATASVAVNSIEEKVTEKAGELGFDTEGLARQNTCGEACVQECLPKQGFANRTKCNRDCMKECMSAFFTDPPTSPPVTASASSP